MVPAITYGFSTTNGAENEAFIVKISRSVAFDALGDDAGCSTAIIVAKIPVQESYKLSLMRCTFARLSSLQRDQARTVFEDR
jgi:hypothetical protein